MLEIHPLTTDKLNDMNGTRVRIRGCRLYHTSSEIETTMVEIEDGFKITADKPIPIVRTADDNVVIRSIQCNG